LEAAANGMKAGCGRIHECRTDWSKLIQKIYGANPTKEVNIWILTK